MTALLEPIGRCLHDDAFTALFFDAWVKSLALLAVAGGLCLCCRRAAAATRHWIWFLALASSPCLLVLSAAPHAWQRPLWSLSTGFDSGNQFSLALDLAPAPEAANPAPAVPPAETAPASTAEVRARSRQPLAAHFSDSLLVLGMVIWLLGILVGLLSVLAGQLQLRRLARNALPLDNPDWTLLLQEASDKLRLWRPVRLLQSTGNPMPLTWGWRRPVVLLPADAAHWPTERRRVVLLHELAHAKRWDCLTQTVARIVCALYWINPLVWLAARRMCIEREQACDDLVLSSGCRASDYATHLVDIARTFRRAPQLAGIAMVRSSQLQTRITAIVDASRARRLRPFTALAILGLMGALALSVGGSSSDTSRKQVEDTALRQQQIARLQTFAQKKEEQSRELAAKASGHITPEFQSFFDAAIQGDWRTVTNRYAYYMRQHPQYSKGTNDMEVQLRTAYWQPVLELDLAYDQVVNCEPKYTAIFAEGVINSIPAGSIYFGGTDPGRGVPTAFCKSHTDGDPFFTLTQNALADNSYLDYLRAMYGGKIYTPTAEDSQHCFQEYMADAQRRLADNKLKPGEDVKLVDGKVNVSGQVAVMSINGLLTRVVFDHNPDREFYIEESFPLDWMYPYLEPHGLIMKLNRQPLGQLPEEVIARDHEYWRKLVAGMLGDWLDDKTTVREVADFVDRVYVRHDFKGFTGDSRFIQNDYAKRIFSKLRSSIGGLYAWRLGPAAPPQYVSKSNAEKEALVQEADFSFRQAYAICPSSPEAVFRYVQLLLQLNRMDDALLVAQIALKLDPDNRQFAGLVESLRSYKKQAAGKGQTQSTLQQMEQEVRNNPTNSQAALNLAGAYLETQQTNLAIQVLDKLLEDPRADGPGVLGVAQAYARMQNVPKLEATLERLVKVTPASPEAWYDLAALKASLHKSSEALAALRQALDLSAVRLKQNPIARDLLQRPRSDVRFDSLRQTPEFEKLVPSNKVKAEPVSEAANAVGQSAADRIVSLDHIGPSLAQLGQGWTSNSVVVMVDQSNPTKEFSNEGAGWLRAAHNIVGQNGREAQTVFRYWYGQSSILVWIVRCRSKEDIGDHWGRDYDAKTEASLDSLPKVGDEVRFYQRGGTHNNIAFRRANYLIIVEGVSTPIEKLKQLAEALDSNLLNAQKGHVVEGTNQGKQMHIGTLTGAQAEALAEQLANEKAKALYKCQPFRKGTPAHFVQGHWVWHDLRGQGSLDVEATVTFAADGTNPEVDVILLDSRHNLQLPPP